MPRKIFSHVSSLSGVNRFSMYKLFHEENVLEHSGMCAKFCLILGLRCNALWPGAMNMGILLTKALIHDWDESLTGDVARPTKYYSNTLRKELANFERAGIAKLAEAFCWPELVTLHAEAKEGPEGLLVAIADYSCAVHRVAEETLVHHNYALLNTAKEMGAVCKRIQEKITHVEIVEIKNMLNEWVDVLEDIRGQVTHLNKATPFQDLHNAH